MPKRRFALFAHLIRYFYGFEYAIDQYNRLSSKGLHLKKTGTLYDHFEENNDLRYLYAEATEYDFELYGDGWEGLCLCENAYLFRKPIPLSTTVISRSFQSTETMEETRWLQTMAEQGYSLLRVSDKEYELELRQEGETVQYRIESCTKEELAAFTQSYRAQNWQFLCRYGQWLYLSKGLTPAPVMDPKALMMEKQLYLNTQKRRSSMFGLFFYLFLWLGMFSLFLTVSPHSEANDWMQISWRKDLIRYVFLAINGIVIPLRRFLEQRESAAYLLIQNDNTLPVKNSRSINPVLTMQGLLQGFVLVSLIAWQCRILILLGPWWDVQEVKEAILIYSAFALIYLLYTMYSLIKIVRKRKRKKLTDIQLSSN